MVTRSKALRQPTYLGGGSCRPPMAGRSLSGLSTVSVASSTSQQSDDDVDEPSTHPTTPSRPATSTETSSPAKDKLDPISNGAVPVSVTSAPASRSNLSRPIAIQVPAFKKFNSAPNRTPPEPLSARGDLLGGYFPMHEDPSVRVRKTHPFHHNPTAAKADQSRMLSSSVAGSYSTPGAFMPYGSFAPGAHETFMPTGKYYPTNYEKRKSRKKGSESQASSSGPSSSSSSPTKPEAQSVTKDNKDRASPFHQPEQSPNNSQALVATPDIRVEAASTPSASVSQDMEKMRQQMRQYQQGVWAQTTLAMSRTTSSIPSALPAGAHIPTAVTPHLVDAPREFFSPRRGHLVNRAISNDESRVGQVGYTGETLERLAAMSIHDQQPVPDQTAAEGMAPAASRLHSRTSQGTESHLTVSTPPSFRERESPLGHDRNPKSPRLVPAAGSPGPMTPMALDTFGVSGGILARGQGSEKQGRRRPVAP